MNSLRDGHTPLHNAAKDGQHQNVKLMIEAGADANARNRNLDTPLLLATKGGHEKTIDQLIKAHCDVSH